MLFKLNYYRVYLAIVLAALGLCWVSGINACFDSIPPNTLDSTGTIKLSGKVVEVCNNEGVSFANIKASAVTAQKPFDLSTTDSAGRFTLYNGKPGNWVLDISLKQYLQNSYPLFVPNNIPSSMDEVILYLTQYPKTINVNENEPIPLDLLLVLDNGPGSQKKRQILVEVIKDFIYELINAYQADINGIDDKYHQFALRVGVIRSVRSAHDGSCERVGSDDGTLLNFNEKCSSSPYPWIQQFIKFNPQQEYKDDVSGLVDSLACISIALGENACPVRQPLTAIMQALNHPANQDFFNKTNDLAMIILSDTDDCSVTGDEFFKLEAQTGEELLFRCAEQGVRCNDQSIQNTGSYTNCDAPYSESLEALSKFVDVLNQKLLPGHFFLGVISGSSNELEVEAGLTLKPSCTDSNVGSTYPAVRLKKTTDLLTRQGAFADICYQPMKDILASMAHQIVYNMMLTDCPKP